MEASTATMPKDWGRCSASPAPRRAAAQERRPPYAIARSRLQAQLGTPPEPWMGVVGARRQRGESAVSREAGREEGGRIGSGFSYAPFETHPGGGGTATARGVIEVAAESSAAWRRPEPVLVGANPGTLEGARVLGVDQRPSRQQAVAPWRTISLPTKSDFRSPLTFARANSSTSTPGGPRRVLSFIGREDRQGFPRGIRRCGASRPSTLAAAITS